jgi:hypothetical protein
VALEAVTVQELLDLSGFLVGRGRGAGGEEHG